MSITDAEIHALKPKKTPYKVSVGRGAYLLVKPNGRKYWRLKYHLDGKENLYSLGVFPRVSVQAAMAERDSVRALIRRGISPSVVRRDTKANAEGRTPLFRLGLSIAGALRIETEAYAITLTRIQTQTLATFLWPKAQREKESG